MQEGSLIKVSDLMIFLKNVEKKFGKTKVLENISFNIQEGDVIAYVGPNGAGKTTTIKLILGLLKPSAGEVKVFSENPYSSLNARKKIDFVLDHPGVDDDLTAYENLKFYSMLYHAKVNNIDNILKKVELYGVRNKLVKTFSRGMKQRLTIARLFLRKPKAIIMDEPTSGLDVDGKLLVRDLIKELTLTKIPMLISSHDLYELQQICNKVILIFNGKIVKMDSIENILKSESEDYQIIIKDEAPNSLLRSLEMYGFTSYDSKEKRIFIRLMAGKISEVINVISKENIEIKSIDKVQTTLEDVYRKEKKRDV